MIAERVEKPRTLYKEYRDMLLELARIHLEIDIPKRRSGAASPILLHRLDRGGTVGRFGAFGLRTISGLPVSNYRPGGRQ